MQNKIEMIDNFLSPKECYDLINYYKKNESFQKPHPVENNKNIIDIDITEVTKFNDLFKKINKHVCNQKCKIEYTKIVRWTDDCYQNLHLDTSSSNTIYSSIIYLNDNYLGGQTFFEEGLVMKPVAGRALFFSGTHYKHGVMPVKKGPRYTLATWYKGVDKNINTKAVDELANLYWKTKDEKYKILWYQKIREASYHLGQASSEGELSPHK